MYGLWAGTAERKYKHLSDYKGDLNISLYVCILSCTYFCYIDFALNLVKKVAIPTNS